MDIKEDIKPDFTELFDTGDRLMLIHEMLTELLSNYHDGRISKAVYDNGMSMIERLSGGEKIR